MKAIAVAMFLVAAVEDARSQSSLPDLESYSSNKNVSDLQRYVITQQGDDEQLRKTALLAGYAILYDFAMKDGGAEKFGSFSNDCYRLAFASGEMKYILNCYIVINTVVDQIERTAKVQIASKFDELLVQFFEDQQITDDAILSEIKSQFASAWREVSKEIEKLTVDQAMTCINEGMGSDCRF